MKNEIKVRQDAVSLLGVLPDNPDAIPLSPPEGFIWITGGCIGGPYENYGVAECRVQIGRKRLDFDMTLADALSLRELLDQAIDTMRECGDDEFIP